jgi:hypothetical protein
MCLREFLLLRIYLSATTCLCDSLDLAKWEDDKLRSVLP